MAARMLTAAEAGEYLGRTEDAVRQMAYRRQIPFFKQGRTVRFDVRELDKWIAQHTTPAAAAS